jgi:hypothetical protein
MDLFTPLLKRGYIISLIAIIISGVSPVNANTLTFQDSIGITNVSSFSTNDSSGQAVTVTSVIPDLTVTSSGSSGNIVGSSAGILYANDVTFTFNAPVLVDSVLIGTGSGQQTETLVGFDASDKIAFVLPTMTPTSANFESFNLSNEPQIQSLEIFTTVSGGLLTIADLNYAAVVPVPASVWLFGSVLAGLIEFHRRKASQQ